MWVALTICGDWQCRKNSCLPESVCSGLPGEAVSQSHPPPSLQLSSNLSAWSLPKLPSVRLFLLCMPWSHWKYTNGKFVLFLFLFMWKAETQLWIWCEGQKQLSATCSFIPQILAMAEMGQTEVRGQKLNLSFGWQRLKNWGPHLLMPRVCISRELGLKVEMAFKARSSGVACEYPKQQLHQIPSRLMS